MYVTLAMEYGILYGCECDMDRCGYVCGCGCMHTYVWTIIITVRKTI